MLEGGHISPGQIRVGWCSAVTVANGIRRIGPNGMASLSSQQGGIDLRVSPSQHY